MRSIRTSNASPGSAPSTKNGPVSGLPCVAVRRTPVRSKPAESTVLVTTRSPGFTVKSTGCAAEKVCQYRSATTRCSAAPTGHAAKMTHRKTVFTLSPYQPLGCSVRIFVLVVGFSDGRSKLRAATVTVGVPTLAWFMRKARSRRLEKRKLAADRERIVRDQSGGFHSRADSIVSARSRDLRRLGGTTSPSPADDQLGAGQSPLRNPRGAVRIGWRARPALGGLPSLIRNRFLGLR